MPGGDEARMIRALGYCKGAVEELPADRLAAKLNERAQGDGDHDFIWVHIRSNGEVPRFLDGLELALPPSVRRALLAIETRPRCEPIDRGVLVNLRLPGIEGQDEGDLLPSIRLWAERGLILSVAFRPSLVSPLVEAEFRAGALHDPGDVIISYLSHAAEVLDGVVARIGDSLDDIECEVAPGVPLAVRRQVTRLRSEAIAYRRFVGPQRTAAERLTQIPLDWLDDDERAAVREAADRFARMNEELEAVRERAAVLHEELTDLRAEKMDARSLQIAIVAMIFLPLTFVTGLLGMNVQGIPWANAPWAFWGVVAVCVLIGAAVSGWFAWRKWNES
jgi:zinc transporter